ncbi:hypothetical protein NC651_032056 [Populus alba x Populus x berolinensis]|nr:hypothetical protein NC651_032056 [Populus alba x Populus x berolinensis]
MLSPENDGVGLWSLGPLFGIQGKQGTRDFSGSKLNFNLARYATSDQHPLPQSRKLLGCSWVISTSFLAYQQLAAVDETGRLEKDNRAVIMGPICSKRMPCGEMWRNSLINSLNLALILEDKNLIGRGLLLQVLELIDSEEDWSKLCENKTAAAVALVTESSN